MNDGCYFCGGGDGVLETHHIVPQRYGGSDAAENVVDLCPTCHERLERLYDKRFYNEVRDALRGQDGEDYSREECHSVGCTAPADHELEWKNIRSAVCDAHKVCAHRDCDRRRVTPRPYNDGEILYCEDHATCSKDGCENTDTAVYRAEQSEINIYFRPYCTEHGETATILGAEFQRRWSDD